MQSLRDVLEQATAKRTAGSELTELEKLVLWQMGEDMPECARWSQALRDFRAMRSECHLPSSEPVLGGAYCWDTDSPREYKCVAMDEGGYAHLVCTSTGTTVHTHTRDLTTRSPFGRFERLDKVAHGSMVYYNQTHPHETPSYLPMQVVEPDGDYIVLRNHVGGRVLVHTAAAGNTLVSYVPPVWSSYFNGKVEWRVDPFMHTLFLDYGRYTGGGTLKCRADIDRAVDALKRDLPALWAAWTFLKASPGLVFKVPGYEYAVWTSVESWSPSHCYTRASAIPEGAIPACWAHGAANVRPYGGMDVRTGWYMSPWGVRFTRSNTKISYGSSTVFVVSKLELQFTDCTLTFGSAEEAQTFVDAYTQKTIDLTRCTPEHRTVIQEMCAGASSSSSM